MSLAQVKLVSESGSCEPGQPGQGMNMKTLGDVVSPSPIIYELQDHQSAALRGVMRAACGLICRRPCNTRRNIDCAIPGNMLILLHQRTRQQ